MKKTILYIIFYSITCLCFAQSHLVENCKPINGEIMLAIFYSDINFTESEVQDIETLGFIEIVLDIDKNGNATYKKLNGTYFKYIETIIKNYSKNLPKFKPKKINGKAVASEFYFILDYFNDAHASKYKIQIRNKDNDDLFKIE